MFKTAETTIGKPNTNTMILAYILEKFSTQIDTTKMFKATLIKYD